MAESTKEKRLFIQHSGFLMPISLPKYLMGSSPPEPCPRATLHPPSGMVHAGVGQIVTNSVSARFLAVATRL